MLGVDLTDEESAEDIDTIGGFIVTLAGRVPSRSEVIVGPAGLEFEVLDADPRRVKRLRIHRRDGRHRGRDQRRPALSPRVLKALPLNDLLG